MSLQRNKIHRSWKGGDQFTSYRKSQSYTDISTQISGYNSNQKWRSENFQSIDRRTVKKQAAKSRIDYAFLRQILGLKTHMGTRNRSGNECFVSEELKEAVMKLRKEVKDLKLDIKDKNWLKTLEDLGDLNDLEMDFLESLYMLRNAYKKEVFSSTQAIEDIDLGEVFEGHPFIHEWEHNQPLFPNMPNHNRSQSPTSTTSRLSSDCSSDVESTTSSAIRRRPAKPKIHLSSASFSDLAAKEDEPLIFKAGSPILTSEKLHATTCIQTTSETQYGGANRVPERPDSADSSTSYLNLVEENVAFKSFSDENGDLSPTTEDIKKAKSKDDYGINSKQSNSRIFEAFRSDSPTSKLLQPMFSYAMSEDMFMVLQRIRSELSPKLSRLRRLENENKLLAVLQVKLAVLQEEKRQLLNTLKQKRSARQSLSSNHSSKTSSPQSSPVSFQSESDDAFVIRPSPHRAKTSKTTQTVPCESKENEASCPLCGRNNSEDQTKEELAKLVAQIKIVGNSNEKLSYKNETEDFICMEENRKNEIVRPVVRQNVSSRDAATRTSCADLVEKGIGDACVFGNANDACTETIPKQVADFAIGNGTAQLSFSNASTQDSVDLTDVSSQYDEISCDNKSILAGCPSCEFVTTAIQCSPSLRDASFGDSIAEKVFVDREVQEKVSLSNKAVNCVASTADISSMCGCSLAERSSIGLQASIPKNDFMCGDEPAVQETLSFSCQATVESRQFGTSPVLWEMVEFGMQCNLDKKELRTLGIGENNVNEIVCDNCLKKEFASIGVGSYNESDTGVFLASGVKTDDLCKIDDKLCECIVPDLCETGTGDSPVDTIICDLCLNRRFTTTGCGEDRIDNLLCDSCGKRQVESRGCGDDDVNVVLCDDCERRRASHDIGVGDASIFEDTCEKCQSMNDVSGFVNLSLFESEVSSVMNDNGQEQNTISKDANENIEREYERQRIISGSSDGEFCEEVSKIMANSTLSWQPEQKPVICNYCGNKVDLNDANLDLALTEMRNNLGAYKRNGIDAAIAAGSLSEYVNIEEIESNTDELLISDESGDEDDSSESIKNDIVESCKMLQLHLSGEKPLKQQLMLKYLANIEVLWFQTVKKKRANAAVVKSYIDLFQSRIPELLDTIINLMDQDGNTALHFALTYKNTGVVSILLDSQECKVDFVNKAGYSPIMLAALAGFDSKTDKYVMQRLLRAGDINAKNRETGQTPLMFAVSRGHAGMVESLLDAGADVNETDNDGSTALMCACENGSMTLVKALLSNPDCDSTKEDHEGSTALSIAMDAKRRDLALLIYGSLNFDARGRIKLTPSKQSLLGLGTRRSPSPAIGKI